MAQPRRSISNRWPDRLQTTCDWAIACSAHTSATTSGRTFDNRVILHLEDRQMLNRMGRLAACAVLTITLFIPGGFGASGYHQLRKIAIGGDGGWDYLIADGDAGRVYVSHSAEVDVVDTKSGKVIGKIDGLHGVHGIALAHEFKRGFI